MDKGIIENSRRLKAFIKMFKYFDFYVLEITNCSVKAQAKFDPKLLVFAAKHKFKVIVDMDYGFIELYRDIYDITLT